MIILDTNVISELMRAAPTRQVRDWMNEQAPTTLYATAVTQAEITHGIHLLPRGKRRDELAAAAAAVFARDFAERILVFGSDAARAYGKIAASRQRAGRPMSTLDAQIAAIAAAVDARLATRNTADFDGCGLELIDPWEAT